MQKAKRITLAATLALYAYKLHITKDAVQAMKKAPEHSTKRAILKLAPDLGSVELVEEDAKNFLKLLRRKDDRWLAKEHPHISELWNDNTAAPATQGRDNVTTLPQPRTMKELFTEYNQLLKLKSLTPLKVWKESRANLEKRIVKLRQSIEHDIPAWQVYPTAVAEGAYDSTLEALHKTGHTQAGPSRGAEKAQKHKERAIARRLKQDPNAPSIAVSSFSPNKRVTTPSNGDTRSTSDHVSLADIARTIKMDPRVARAIARRQRKQVAKLELKGTKYKFAPGSLAAVVKILQGAVA